MKIIVYHLEWGYLQTTDAPVEWTFEKKFARRFPSEELARKATSRPAWNGEEFEFQKVRE